MSQIDTELNLLKQRLATLEEQKRIEDEKERTNPIKILGEILDEKKKLRNVGRPAKTNVTYNFSKSRFNILGNWLLSPSSNCSSNCNN